MAIGTERNDLCSRPGRIVLAGVVPPPVHGQAIATSLVFEADWGDADVRRVSLQFNKSLRDVGKIRFGKILRLFGAIRELRANLRDGGSATLYYTPGIPGIPQAIRDFVLLRAVRKDVDELVLHFHSGGIVEYFERRPWIWRLLRRAFRAPDTLVIISERERKLGEFLAAKRVVKVANGVRVPEGRTRVSGKDEILRVLFLGNLARTKGIFDVLDTARILRERGLGEKFEILICGQWGHEDDEEVFSRALEENGLQGCVKVHGSAHGDEKWRVFEEADLFFFPSHFERENCPLVILEALGMGVPVLTTRWRGIPEIMGGRDAGWLCDIRAVDQFADVIESVLEDPARIEIKSRNARALFEERYRESRYVREVQEAVLTSGRDDGGAKSPPSESGKSRPLMLVGHFGGHNTGDEAMLAGALRLLSEETGEAEVRGVVTTKRPYESPVLENYPHLRQVRLIFLSMAKAIPRRAVFILCGGTHFHDDYIGVRLLRHHAYMIRFLFLAAIARSRGCRVELLGMGIGPVRTMAAKLVIRAVLALTHRVTVRDRASWEELQRLGYHGKKEIYFDLAAGLCPAGGRPPREMESRPVLGISVTVVPAAYHRHGEDWVTAVGERVGERLARDDELRVRIFEIRGGKREGDGQLSEILRQRIERAAGRKRSERVRVIPYDDDPGETFKRMQQCSHFLATRYHAAILGFLAGCRLGVLAYHRKVLDFSKMVELDPKLVVDLSSQESRDGIGEMIDFLLDHTQPSGSEALGGDPRGHLRGILAGAAKLQGVRETGVA